MANDLAAQIVAASITAEELGTDRMLVQLKRRDGVTLAFPGGTRLESLFEAGWNTNANQPDNSKTTQGAMSRDTGNS